MSTLQDALRARLADPTQRLRATARLAVQQNERNLEGAASMVFSEIKGDAELLWALSERFRRDAVMRLLVDVAGPDLPDARVGGSPPKPVRAPTGAVAAIARRTILDTYEVGGRCLGDATPTQARSWARKQKLKSRFIEDLCANLPPDRPIRELVSAERAEETLERVRTEIEAEI